MKALRCLSLRLCVSLRLCIYRAYQCTYSDLTACGGVVCVCRRGDRSGGLAPDLSGPSQEHHPLSGAHGEELSPEPVPSACAQGRAGMEVS